MRSSSRGRLEIPVQWPRTAGPHRHFRPSCASTTPRARQPAGRFSLAAYTLHPPLSAFLHFVEHPSQVPGTIPCETLGAMRTVTFCLQARLPTPSDQVCASDLPGRQMSAHRVSRGCDQRQNPLQPSPPFPLQDPDCTHPAGVQTGVETASLQMAVFIPTPGSLHCHSLANRYSCQSSFITRDLRLLKKSLELLLVSAAPHVQAVQARVWASGRAEVQSELSDGDEAPDTPALAIEAPAGRLYTSRNDRCQSARHVLSSAVPNRP